MIALTECGYYADSNDASKNAPIGNIEAQWNNGDCMVVVYAMVWQCG